MFKSPLYSLLCCYLDERKAKQGGKQTQFLKQTASLSFDVNRHKFDFTREIKILRPIFERRGTLWHNKLHQSDHGHRAYLSTALDDGESGGFDGEAGFFCFPPVYCMHKKSY